MGVTKPLFLGIRLPGLSKVVATVNEVGLSANILYACRTVSMLCKLVTCISV